MAYERIWERFVYWCERRGFPTRPTTPEVFAAYLTAAASEGIPTVPKLGKPSKPGKPLNAKSLWVHLSAVAFAHKLADLPNPIAQIRPLLLEGTLRSRTTVPKKKHPLLRKQIKAAVLAIPQNRKGVRDRAVLLVAFFSGGRRRSEIADMRFEHLRRIETGFLWTVAQTKISDKPYEAFIPQLADPAVCPVRALTAWLNEVKVTSGPVFCGVDQRGRLRFRRDLKGARLGIQPAAVAQIVKDAALRIGLDPDLFGGHSLRSGFATQAAMKGGRLETIMERGQWKTYETVKGYIREGQAGDPNDPMRLLLEQE